MKFTKIKPKKISDVIYEQIKNLILSGELIPDEKIPAERELATKLGVSRPSLREALNRLEAQGFLEQIQGDGTYVRSITSNAFDKAMEEFIKRDDAVVDLMEVRKILEIWAARTAAERANEDEINQMAEYLAEMKQAAADGELGHVSDANFHSTITYATHNVLLIHIMNNIYQWIERVSYEVRSRMHTDSEGSDYLYEQHCNILEAIKDRDPEKAYNAMLTHMEYVEEKVKHIFED
jgi:GntR family transcriptional repressor for pyruvate dehydrogenase complex